jgi:peptide deformylase
MSETKILSVKNREELALLRKKTPVFYFAKIDKKEIAEIIKKMRQAMTEHNGVGLAANQLGLPWRMFIARDENKFYVIFNPKIIKKSREVAKLEEGCLSVPGEERLVPRPEKIVLAGMDRGGKKIKISAWGLLGRIFQHEIDHLNGLLIIDRGKPVISSHSGNAL